MKTSQTSILERGEDNKPLTCVKTTPDGKTLVGYRDIQPNEILKIWNLEKRAWVHDEILDLEDQPDLKEDPSKLMFLTQDNSFIFMREARKGIKALSLEDGTKVWELK